MFSAFDATEWRHGWRTVAGASVGMGTGISLYLLVVSLFVVHISETFGYSRGQIGLAQMVAFLTGAIALPLIGRLIDRIGFRRIVLVCVPALSLLYLGIALQPGYYPFHLVLMVWGGIFGGGTGAIAYTRPVIAAFRHQRGLALGVATAGTSVTAMIVPPLLATAMATFGWRAGLYAMSAITGLIGLPLALTFIGRAREANAARSARAPERPITRTSTFTTADATLRDAVRTTSFWLLLVALVSINIPGSGIVGQLAAMLNDKGVSTQSSAVAMSIYAAGLLVGRLFTGFALDRLPVWVVAAGMTAVPGIGVALLMAPSTSFTVAALAAWLIGMQQGSEVDLIAYFVSRQFGLTHYGSVYGAIGIAGALSTGVALVFFGRVHDVTGSYDLALRTGLVAFAIGAIAFGAVGARLNTAA